MALTKIIASMVSFVQAGAGAIMRTVQAKLSDTVSVKDFGAVGTANPANVVADTAAFMAALATGKNVIVPQGTYYVSQTMNVGYAQCLWGSGRGKTYINYTGTGTGIYCGAAGNISLVYDIELRDFTLFCTNMTTRVNYGVVLENCVYFCLDSITVLGPASPNDAVPANRVLTGSGIYLTNNTIIGRISRCSSRLWDQGYYLKTLPASQSYWTAAIVIDGQGELANVNKGIVVGDPTVALFSGVGLTIRDMSFQGCYQGGLYIYSGDNTVVEGNYFEGNGSYDIVVGTVAGAPAPIGCKIIRNTMNAENIGTTVYGTFPYLTKIFVVRGAFTAIRDNNMSISSAIALIGLDTGADSTSISGNRLNSTIAAGARITDGGTNTDIRGNYPNQQPTAKVGTFARTLSSTGVVAYTGVGFRPTSLRLTASIETAKQTSDGWTDGGTSRCLSINGLGEAYASAYAVRIIKETAADTAFASIVSFDKDGFTLNWGKTGAPPANELIVNYIATR